MDGKWVDADSGETFPVLNPATGDVVAEVPRMSGAETRRRSRPRSERSPSGRRAPQGSRTRATAARRPHARARGRPRAAHGDRAGEAARGGAGRGAVRGLLLRVVRGGGEARLRRHDPVAVARQADPRDEGAGRRHGGDHALELPRSDADAQVRARARRRLHDGAEAGRADAALRARRSRRSPRRRASRQASSPSSRAPPRTRLRSAAR